jgi:dipeptidyl aminopeptidase/acylaminoacyl peptidase
MTLTGKEVAMVENVVTVPDSAWAAYSVADDGTLAYVPAPSLTGRTLVWIDRTGKVERAAMPPRAYSFPSLSPDGRNLAVQVADGPRRDVWIFRLADGAETRLTVEGLNSRPQWSPDGRHLTFSTKRERSGYSSPRRSTEALRTKCSPAAVDTICGPAPGRRTARDWPSSRAHRRTSPTSSF